MQNYAQIDNMDYYALHNNFIISVITYSSNPSTYKLFILVKPELSMHVPMGHQNISFVS